MAKHYPIVLDGTTLKELPTGDGLSLLDNEKLTFGADSDLQIYHDGSHSRIVDNGTGDLRIQAGNLVMMNAAGTETFLTGVQNGAVSSYYDNSKKFETTSAGVSVTGRATGTQTTDNDGSFDLSASNHFVCTPTANFTLTFTNHTAGQAGTIILINSGGYTVSAAATTKVMGADLLTTITTAGTYVLGYVSDGTNTRIYNSGAQQ